MTFQPAVQTPAATISKELELAMFVRENIDGFKELTFEELETGQVVMIDSPGYVLFGLLKKKGNGFTSTHVCSIMKKIRSHVPNPLKGELVITADKYPKQVLLFTEPHRIADTFPERVAQIPDWPQAETA